uniref:ELM2 domain-containing protein n=1 Tax=Steinernema glaseri TaxID=37863 RepID=A0A1I8ADA1_9BILA
MGCEDPYEEFGDYRPSTEIMFQEIVKQAQQDVHSGADGSARRSSRRLVRPQTDTKPAQTVSTASTSPSKVKRAPAPRTVDEPCIRVGSRHQAEIVELREFQMPSNDQREAEDDRAECVWQPDRDNKVTARDMEDFVAMCRRHMDVGTDLAMRSLYRHGLSVTKALENMEADFKDNWKTRFLKVEDNALVWALFTYGKNFAKISKSVKTRKIHECIGRYYDVKKKICFMTKHICPTLMRTNTDDYKALKRSQCENCSANLFERVQKCEVRGRRRTMLCPPCDLYAKMKKMYRPCTLKYDPNGMTEEERDKLYYEHTAYFDINEYLGDRLPEDHTPPPNHILTGHYYVPDPSALDVSQPYEKKIPVFTEPHENCFFVSTTQNIRWEKSVLDFEMSQKERIVDGFLKFGKNFSKIAKFVNMPSVETIRHFYEVYGQEYRLDFLIAQYNRRVKSRGIIGRNNDSDEDSENHTVRRRMTMRVATKKRTMRPRAATTAGTSGTLRRTTRKRAVRELS